MATELKQWRRNNVLVKEFLSSDIIDIDCSASLYNEVSSSSSNRDVTAIVNSEYNSDSILQDEDGNVKLNITNSLSSSLSSFIIQDEEPNVELNITNSLSSVLASWATRNRCSRACVNELLLILKGNGHNDLPLDVRMLMQTPRSVNCYSKCGGSYVYLGIEYGIKRKLQKNPHNFNNIELLVNVDGLPLFKSTGTTIMPILCSFRKSEVFIVSLFCGQSKPNSIEDFLNDFLIEYKDLHTNGLVFNSITYTLSIKLFICDAPARAFLKCIKSHTGYFSCERCTIKGSYNGRVVFHLVECPLRTDVDFAAMLYEKHQLQRTPLLDYNISCVRSFSLDYMHLVCLGVIKRMLKFLIGDGPRAYRLSHLQISEIVNRLTVLNGKMPSEFSRQPRTVIEWKRWKATECRQFLLYTGCVVLKSIVNEGVYTHFLKLSVAFNILLDSNANNRTPQMLEYARKLLVDYVSSAIQFFGPTFSTYNVHNLLHIVDDAENFNCSLDDISAFQFENYMQVIKKFVKSAHNPLAQIVKRSEELENCGSVYSNKPMKTVCSIQDKDCWFLLNNGKFCRVKSLYENGYCGCAVLRNNELLSFFNNPCDSKSLNIVRIKKNYLSEKCIISKADFSRKVVCMSYKDGFVLASLVHDIVW
ncbi:uncharacterized protein LOC136071678 isoform X2 [Hydra vulgaris]